MEKHMNENGSFSIKKSRSCEEDGFVLSKGTPRPDGARCIGWIRLGGGHMGYHYEVGYNADRFFDSEGNYLGEDEEWVEPVFSYPVSRLQQAREEDEARMEAFRALNKRQWEEMQG